MKINMKRLLSLAAMFLCSMATSFAQFSGSGSGTESDPYLILNPIQLSQMRNFLNKSGVYFKLMADIDLTEFIEDEYPSEGWMPIGTSSAPFSGVLDGNGKKISGLWIDRPINDYVGLFAYINAAKIKNLTLTKCSIKGSKNVGALVGYGTWPRITNCVVDGAIVGKTNVGGCIGEAHAIDISDIICSIKINANESVGGVVGKIVVEGYEGSSIIGCEFYGEINSKSNYIGGILGREERISNTQGSVKVSDCHVNANISGVDNVGGVCGRGSGSISSSNFVGEILANSNVGGICGCGAMGGVSFEKCYALGGIIASGNNVGGICGSSRQSIITCYFSGSVMGAEKVGGLVGESPSSIKNSYSNATITGAKYVGGICGYGYGTTIYSNIANAQSVKATNDYVGRIYGYGVLDRYGKSTLKIGQTGTNDENKAWNRTIVIKAGVAQEVSSDLQNGTGVSATTLKLKATYVAMGWDFTETWDIQETECYPYFKTQTAPPVITSSVVSGATTISGNCVNGATVTLDINGIKKSKKIGGTTFSFKVDPLQAGHVVRVSAKVNGKEQSYFATEIVSYLGSGTKADPYQISTAADLSCAYRKGYYKLMKDIDLTSYINKYSSTDGWESIGREGSETIYFDGDGHKITGLWCNSTRDNTGLFSCFANGYIKNLTVETAKGKQVKGGANTGILIGKMINGTIENCCVNGSVADGTPVGGVVGLLDGGKIRLCQASVTINTNGANTYVGGLVGDITSGEITQCVTMGTLTATGANSQAGGLVGKNAATVTNSYSNVNVSSAFCAAGLIAYNFGLVEKCYARGDLSSQNYGAGVIGYNDGGNAIIRKCVAMNRKIDVTFESQSAQNGGYGQRVLGGYKNGAPDPELNNYALKTMQLSVNDIPQKVYNDIMNGTAKTEAQLMKSSTYKDLDWDMTKIWNIKASESYPWLRKNLAAVSIAIPASLFIEKGKTEVLTPAFYPSTSSDKNLTWKSSNTKVVTVTSSGKVKGVKAGTATITCTSLATGTSTTCTVTVGYVKLDKSEAIIKKGKTMTLTATVYPSSLEDKSVMWESSNTNVATVTSDGKVKGIKVGKATITCKSVATGLSTTCDVTIGLVCLNKYKLGLKKGATEVLTPTVYPSSLSDKSVTWESSDTKVATVTSSGKVKGIKAGTATITCTSVATGLSRTCTVTVGYVKIDKSEVIVKKGQTVTLNATVYPSSLEDKSVIWESSNTKIATVSSSGKVKGVKAGTVSIICTSVATGLSTACTVTVGYVSLDNSEITVMKGKTVTLNATVYPSSLTDKSVTWESSNTKIATVTSTGKVKGVKAGTTTILCTSVATGLSTTCIVTVTASSSSRSVDGDDDSVTGIKGMDENPDFTGPYDVYDLKGLKVRHQVTSLDGLPAGIYIVNGKKVLKK